ncbi:hypothetical protein HDU79_001995 [Rhizoclosmatium sp. JEL0117]|nr:hypothetical protein HDU79_001995 [Rhizoclosmatium sp. JEL0117]
MEIFDLGRISRLQGLLGSREPPGKIESLASISSDLIMEAVVDGRLSCLDVAKLGSVSALKNEIPSGTVLVFRETGGGNQMVRWRDIKMWSPSRPQGAFLLYREVEPHTQTTYVDNPVEQGSRFLNVALRGNRRFIPNGLCKRTIGLTGSDGNKYRIINYFYERDVERCHVDSLTDGLKRPMECELFAGLDAKVETLFREQGGVPVRRYGVGGLKPAATKIGSASKGKKRRRDSSSTDSESSFEVEDDELDFNRKPKAVKSETTANNSSRTVYAPSAEILSSNYEKSSAQNPPAEFPNQQTAYQRQQPTNTHSMHVSSPYGDPFRLQPPSPYRQHSTISQPSNKNHGGVSLAGPSTLNRSSQNWLTYQQEQQPMSIPTQLNAQQIVQQDMLYTSRPNTLPSFSKIQNMPLQSHKQSLNVATPNAIHQEMHDHSNITQSHRHYAPQPHPHSNTNGMNREAFGDYEQNQFRSPTLNLSTWQQNQQINTNQYTQVSQSNTQNPSRAVQQMLHSERLQVTHHPTFHSVDEGLLQGEFGNHPIFFGQASRGGTKSQPISSIIGMPRLKERCQCGGLGIRKAHNYFRNEMDWVERPVYLAPLRINSITRKEEMSGTNSNSVRRMWE